jgi:acetyltransferase-like isoleucine patch superfamily enzyme
MTKEYTVFQGSKIGKKAKIGLYVIIGQPKTGGSSRSTTIIGPNAVIRSHSVIYTDNKIGSNFQTGHHVMIREKNKIGNNVSIGTHTVIEHHVDIGNNVRIHSNAFVPEYTKLLNNAWVGPNVIFTNAKYPQGRGVKRKLKGALVKENAKIGANSTILPGIVIGKNALIGAGSVVTKDVPANKVAAGNPARIIKHIKEINDYKK